MSEQHLYKIVFRHNGDTIELFARQVGPSAIFGFVEVADLVFGARSEVLVDPTEETLRREFEGVGRTHVPMHAVLRIDEVERAGPARVRAGKDEGASNILRAFPVPVVPPGRGSS